MSKRVSENFGISKVSKNVNKTPKGATFVPQDDDGQVVLDAYYATSTLYRNTNTTGNAIYQNKIITYRSLYLHHLVQTSVDQVVSEALASRNGTYNIKVNFQNLQHTFPSKVCDEIDAAFNKILKLLDFNSKGHEIFKRFVVDGCLPYQMIYDKSTPKQGLLELRYIDPKELTKVRIAKKENIDGVEVITDHDVKFHYSPQYDDISSFSITNSGKVLEIDESAIAYATSGLYDVSRTYPLSILDKCIRPINLLMAMENFHAIYVSKYSEDKMVFYIDVGHGSEKQLDQKIRTIAAKLRNKVTFNSSTGQFNDGKNLMDTTRDMFIPRVDGRKTAEVSRIEGGANIGEVSHIVYYKDLAMESLPIPKSRIKPDTPFTSGRATEITRDEVNFQKEIDILRRRFATQLFLPMLKTELICRNVINIEDYSTLAHAIMFDFPADNHYAYLLDMEVLERKVSTIQLIGHDPRLFFPIDEVGRAVCNYTEEQMKKLREIYKQDLTFATETNVEQQNLETLTVINPEPDIPTDEPLPTSGI